MPGVSANESAEIIEQLQQVGQIISQETSALVDALVKTQLDQEDTEKSVARMSLDNNLVKAEKDDLAQKANDLKSDLKVETQKKQEAEGEVKKVMDGLYNLTKDFRALREKSGKGEGSPDREGMIKVCVLGERRCGTSANDDRLLRRRSSCWRIRSIIGVRFG